MRALAALLLGVIILQGCARQGGAASCMAALPRLLRLHQALRLRPLPLQHVSRCLLCGVRACAARSLACSTRVPCLRGRTDAHASAAALSGRN